MKSVLVAALLSTVALTLPHRAAVAAGSENEPERLAIRAVQDAGGSAVRDRILPGHPVTRVCIEYTSDPVGPIFGRLKAFSDLQELEFDWNPISDVDLLQIASLKHLRRLVVWGNGITDGSLDRIAGFDGLEELSMRGHITDAGIKLFARLSKLHILRIGGRFDGSGLAALSELPHLEVVDLSGVRTTPNLFLQLHSLPHLKELDLTCNGEVKDAEMKLIADLPSLERLNLFSEGLTDAGLEALSQARKLNSLYLRNSYVTGRGIDLLRRLPNLEEVRLQALHEDCFAVLATIPGLRSVGFAPYPHGRNGKAAAKPFDQTLSDLKRLARLRSIDLSYADITEEGFKVIGAMTDLEELNLTSTTTNNVGLAHLNGLKKLRVLILENANVTDAAIPTIAQLTSLRTLHLPGGVGDAGLDALASLPELESLEIPGSAITDSGVAKFARFRSLTTLVVGTSGMTDAGVSGLSRLKNLRRLFLVPLGNDPVTKSPATLVQLENALPYTDFSRAEVGF